jgi:hypothetical protein
MRLVAARPPVVRRSAGRQDEGRPVAVARPPVARRRAAARLRVVPQGLQCCTRPAACHPRIPLPLRRVVAARPRVALRLGVLPRRVAEHPRVQVGARRRAVREADWQQHLYLSTKCK